MESEDTMNQDNMMHRIDLYKIAAYSQTRHLIDS